MILKKEPIDLSVALFYVFFYSIDISNLFLEATHKKTQNIKVMTNKFSFYFIKLICLLQLFAILRCTSVTGILGNISSLIPDWSEGHDCTAIGLHGGGMILDIWPLVTILVVKVKDIFYLIPDMNKQPSVIDIYNCFTLWLL